MGEFELIERYFMRGPARRAELGIGDDCALMGGFAISTDMLVSGRHFFADVAPRALGHKALAVNLSDLAAMGAKPRAFTLALALPQADETWLAEFSAGLLGLADQHQCELIGGDTTAGPLTISITVFGDCPAQTALRRDRAEPGDDIWVSGELGGARFAVTERYAGRPLPADHPTVVRVERPTPRIALGLALRHLASAAIDLSDGLIGDLGHICERSRLRARVSVDSLPLDVSLSQLPLRQRRELALAGGDDYELAFTAAPENRLAIEALASQQSVRLSRIGTMTSGSGIELVDAQGKAFHADVRSFDHFA